jgi:hypothetical protein
MKYGRVDLEKTNYEMYSNAKLIQHPSKTELRLIYSKYCRYKKFKSVEPLFDFDIDNSEVIGYYEYSCLVAFTLVHILDSYSVRGYQFAWTYSNPELKLGWIANYHECAFYKHRGFRYYYLGEHSSYKSELSGYEILGSL